MRVLLVGDYPPPPGGIGIHVQQLHSFLQHHQVQSLVLDIGKGGRPAPDVLPVHTGSSFLRALARFTTKGWLIHLHTSGNNRKSWYVAAAVGLTSLASGAGRVLTVHSGLSTAFVASSRTNRALVRLATRGYSRVVAVSSHVAAALASAGVPESKLTVQPAFLASGLEVSPPLESVVSALQTRSPLLTVALHPSPVYGTRLMLQALSQLAERFPNIGLAVMGVGTRAPEFTRAVDEAGVSDRIVNLGELVHGDSLAAIQGSAAFIRPTLADGDAISVREALALGVRCVASDAAERPDGTVLFRSGDVADLARAVGDALQSPPPAHTGPDAGPRLLAMYRELAAARARGPIAHDWAQGGLKS